MRKNLFLLSMLPFLFLFGCGGSGSDPIAGDSFTPPSQQDGGGSFTPPIGDVGGGTTDVAVDTSSYGTVSVTIPATGSSAQAKLVDLEENDLGYHNRARLIVRNGYMGRTCVPAKVAKECVDSEGVCSPEEGGTYTLEEFLALPGYSESDVDFYCVVSQDCKYVVKSPAYCFDTFIDTYKFVDDKALSATEPTTLEANVPAGEDYILDVLTYVRGEMNEAGDAFAADPECVTDDTVTCTNFMWYYGQATEVDVALGEENPVTLTMKADVVQLAFDSGDVDPGDDYQVFVDESAGGLDAVRGEWYLRRELFDNDNGQNYTTERYVHEAGNDDGEETFADLLTPLTLTADIPSTAGAATNGPLNPDHWTYWHQGQFHISDHLLKNDEIAAEDWPNWIFSTNYAGPMNPLATIDITVDGWE